MILFLTSAGISLSRTRDFLFLMLCSGGLPDDPARRVGPKRRGSTLLGSGAGTISGVGAGVGAGGAVRAGVGSRGGGLLGGFLGDGWGVFTRATRFGTRTFLQSRTIAHTMVEDTNPDVQSSVVWITGSGRHAKSSTWSKDAYVVFCENVAR